jgi:hypothetical protein
MLKVHGLVGKPRETEIQKISLKGNGCLIKFEVASQDPRQKGLYHKYPIRVWVPDKEADAFITVVESHVVFWIEHGQWSMRERDDGKMGWPELMVSYNNLHPTKLDKSIV